MGTILVIPKGSTAMGTVTEAVPKKSLGRAGRLEIVLDYVRLKDTEEAPLRAVKDVKGASHTGVMTAGIVATGLLFWPAAPLFLFMHGKNTTIPRGAEITAYVNGELWLEMAKFETGDGTAEANATSKTTDDATPRVDTTDSEHGTITLQSTPFDCEITIDGAYVGYSPATLEITPGKHTLRLVHTGYKEWTTEITLEAGSDVHLNAVLEDQEKQSPPQPQQ